MDGVSFEFVGVTVDRDGAHVLDAVDVTLADHGVTVIVGPSGSGKSTLLRLCNRLSVPTSGTVRFRGVDISGIDPLRLRREVGMVFQRPVALPGTVADNLREADPAATDADIAAALQRVGLAGLADRDASALSGGEAQRMCLARTLMADPQFVLFDEVTSSLDPHAALGIETLATELAGSGTPSAWVTHDLDQMRRLAHHLVVVIDGRIAQQGDADQVLGAPTASVAAFLHGGAA
jgi:putative ABC transport system ATP-binding protein